MRFVSCSAAVIVLVFFADPCFAQRGGASPERMFQFLDRDGDGVLRGDELNRFPPMRNMIEEMEIDPERGLSMDQFQEVSQEMRQRMSEQGGFRGRGDFGGDERRGDRFGRRGDDGENSDSDRGGDRRSRRGSRFGGDDESRGEDDRDSERGDERRSRFSRDSSRGEGEERSDRRRSRQPEEPPKNSATTKQRVTLELPSNFSSRDKNGDGQIGLYEWSQSDFAEFARLDFNGDGFLTPRELSSTVRTPTNSTVTTVASIRPARTTAAAATPAAPATEFSRPSRSTGSQDNGDRYQRAAEYAFRALDRNKDGNVEAEEWKQSRSIRPMFEKAGVDLSQSMSNEAFIATYIRLRSQ